MHLEKEITELEKNAKGGMIPGVRALSCEVRLEPKTFQFRETWHRVNTYKIMSEVEKVDRKNFSLPP